MSTSTKKASWTHHLNAKGRFEFSVFCDVQTPWSTGVRGLVQRCFQLYLSLFLFFGHLVLNSFVFLVSHWQKEIPICKVLAKFAFLCCMKMWITSQDGTSQHVYCGLWNYSPRDELGCFTNVNPMQSLNVSHAEPRTHWCAPQMIHTRRISKYTVKATCLCQ